MRNHRGVESAGGLAKPRARVRRLPWAKILTQKDRGWNHRVEQAGQHWALKTRRASSTSVNTSVGSKKPNCFSVEVSEDRGVSAGNATSYPPSLCPVRGCASHALSPLVEEQPEGEETETLGTLKRWSRHLKGLLNLSPGPTLWVCGHKGHRLALILHCCHLEILNFEQGGLHFHFALSPAIM